MSSENTKSKEDDYMVGGGEGNRWSVIQYKRPALLNRQFSHITSVGAYKLAYHRRKRYIGLSARPVERLYI